MKMGIGAAVITELVGELERRTGDLPSLYMYIESTLESKNVGLRNVIFASLGYLKEIEGIDVERLRSYPLKAIKDLDFKCRRTMFQAYDDLNAIVIATQKQKYR